MKKDKKNKKLQELDILKFDDIRKTAEREPEPCREFKESIAMGTRDEITEMVIAEAEKE